MAAFGKKQKDLTESHISTIISDGCTIDGNISSTSSIKIDGVVNGNVDAQGVIIGDSGKINGHVKSNEAVIFGAVRGNITVQKLDIKSTGKIDGDISTETIEIDFGAVYNGNVTMGVAAKTKNSNSTAAHTTLEEVH